MTARGLFLIALSVAAFGVGMLVLVDSIWVRWRAHRGKRDLGKIGLRVDDEWLERRERRR